MKKPKREPKEPLLLGIRLDFKYRNVLDAVKMCHGASYRWQIEQAIRLWAAKHDITIDEDPQEASHERKARLAQDAADIVRSIRGGKR